jgi:TolB-like protein
MRNKALGNRSVLEMTENQAKWRQVSGHSRFPHGRIEDEHRAARRGTAQIPQVSSAPPAAKRLLSWKEVAGYLKCNIRSVQRWERGEGLPVHRHIHQRGSTVYAYTNELDAWLWTRRSLQKSRVAAPESSPVQARLYVLPFVNLGDDPQLNLLCNGLTEELILQLSRLDPERLGIVARSNSMDQRTSPRTIPEIGRRLGVSAVMEGCLRASGSRIRVTAQLIRVSDQTHVWTECFDGQVSDPLQFQLDIIRQIVESLQCPGLPPEVRRLLPVAPNLPPRQ